MTFVQKLLFVKNILSLSITLSTSFLQHPIDWCGHYLSNDICSEKFFCEKYFIPLPLSLLHSKSYCLVQQFLSNDICSNCICSKTIVRKIFYSSLSSILSRSDCLVRQFFVNWHLFKNFYLWKIVYPFLSPPFLQDPIAWCSNILSNDIFSKTFIYKKYFIPLLHSINILLLGALSFYQMMFVQIAFVLKQLLGKYFIPLSPPLLQDPIAWCSNFLSIDICSKTFICEK